MRTSEAQFEAKVELIPTAKLVGISRLYSPLLCCKEVYYKYLK